MQFQVFIFLWWCFQPSCCLWYLSCQVLKYKAQTSLFSIVTKFSCLGAMQFSFFFVWTKSQALKTLLALRNRRNKTVMQNLFWEEQKTCSSITKRTKIPQLKFGFKSYIILFIKWRSCCDRNWRVIWKTWTKKISVELDYRWKFWHPLHEN